MNFWVDKVAPAPEPQQSLSLGDEYRAWQRAKAGGNGSSGSAIYSLPLTSEQRAAQRPSIYVDREAKPLQDYIGQEPDPLAAKPGESPEAHRRRILSVARALPADEVEQRLAAIDAGAQDHAQLRQQLDARVSGSGIGIAGTLTPQQRAALVGRFEGRHVEAQGHKLGESLAASPLSAAEMNQIVAARAATQQQPQRTQVPAGSSGIGWTVSR